MAVVKIEPQMLLTVGNWTAYIEGIEMTGLDLFVGTLIVPSSLGEQPQRVNWNASGLLPGGDQTAQGNLNVVDLHDLLKTARLLGAQGV